MLKILFILLVSIHGLIHLIGFIKAFYPERLQSFPLSIPKAQGLLWLTAFLLFAISLGSYLMQIHSWWMWATGAIILSQILIIGSWKEARWGTLLNILLLIFCLSGWGTWQFDRKVAHETKSFLSESNTGEALLTQQALSDLPSIVQNWLKQSQVLEKPSTYRVHLWQEGKMRLQPGGDWLKATSDQWFSTDPPGFIWNADVGSGTLMEFSGRDFFQKGTGNMLIKLYGVMGIVNASGPMIDEGVAIRYLAEIIWFPSAAISPYIQWEEVNDQEVLAYFTYENLKVSGHFYFSREGKVIRFEALRFNEQTKKREKWVVDIDPTQYATFEGRYIPTKAKVSWFLDKGLFTWYFLTVKNAVYNSEN